MAQDFRGVGSLDRRRLAVVRELYAWREAAAAKNNRPSRTIIRDDLLLEIARRGPTKEADLHVIRGLPKRDLTAIVETVRQAFEVPLEDCPALSERDQDPPGGDGHQHLDGRVRRHFGQAATGAQPRGDDAGYQTAGAGALARQ